MLKCIGVKCLVCYCHFRQLVQSRDRIANGLKKLLETNDLVAKMEVPNCCNDGSIVSKRFTGRADCIRARTEEEECRY